jgi:predicted O-methyltransferase YrrM
MSKQLNIGFHLMRVDENSLQDSLRLSNRLYPWSLRENEANILYSLVKNNNLTSGFEIATGFGVSSISIGKAFKETGGRLSSMDAYVEELLGYGLYDHTTHKIKTGTPDGYLMATSMSKALEIDKHTNFDIGWSPNDTSLILDKNEQDFLDFVFIDGGHYPQQVILDLSSVIDKLAYDCIICFHDYGCVGQDSLNLLSKYRFTKFIDYKTGFSLVSYGRGHVNIEI